MPFIKVEFGRRIIVQNEAIALKTKSSDIQILLQGFREVEKHNREQVADVG